MYFKYLRTTITKQGEKVEQIFEFIQQPENIRDALDFILIKNLAFEDDYIHYSLVVDETSHEN